MDPPSYKKQNNNKTHKKTKNKPLFIFFIVQLFDNRAFTYTYLLADKQSGETVLIDPVIELVQRDLNIIRDLKLKLKYACK